MWMLNEKKLKYQYIIYGIILLLYSSIMIYSIFYHEFWRDEFQAWNIARDLSFIDIIKQMQWEGHPCLWHIILMPFAKLGFPPITMGFVSFGFMLATAAIILFKSPFHLPVKIAIVFSSPFLYFFSVNSRVYAIIPFLLSLLCLTYSKRLERPCLYAFILALLVNSHIIMSIFVGIMSLLFFIETICSKRHDFNKKKYIVPILIILAGVLVCYLQISHSLWNNSIVTGIMDDSGYYSENSFQNFLYTLLYGFMNEVNSFIGVYIMEFSKLYIILGVFFLILLVGLIFSFKYTLIVFVSYLFLFCVHTFIWFSLPPRTLMILFYIMFAAWILYHDYCEKGKTSFRVFYVWEVILVIFCFISIPYGYKTLKYDIENPVSGALDTSLYIEENLESASFICPVDYVATSVTGYIHRNIFWSNIRYDNFTFVPWDEYWRKYVTYDDFVDGIRYYVKRHDNVYILYSRYFLFEYDSYMDELLDQGWIELIYTSPVGLNSESYWIYEITDAFNLDTL